MLLEVVAGREGGDERREKVERLENMGKLMLGFGLGIEDIR